LENVQLYGDLHRFVPVLARWRRFRVGEIEVTHHARQFGVSKFGGGRFFRGLMDLLTVFFLLRYDRRPAHFFGAVGSALALAGLVINLYLTVLWLGGESIGQRPLLSLQFLATGLTAELMVHLGAPAHNPYVLRRVVGPREPSAALHEPGAAPEKQRSAVVS
jgi:hypothetical protein